MKKKLQDFLNNVKWDNAAIGGGAGILGGLLFNRFILGNRTWKSHAIASAIGAALGGGGSILYDQLNNGGLGGGRRVGKKDNNKKVLTEDRKTELEDYKKTSALMRDLTGSPTLNVVTRSALHGGFGAGGGRVLDFGQQSLLGARTENIVVHRPGAKTQPEVRVEFGKLGGRGTLNSSDIAKLTQREKEILLSQVNSGKYDVALTADQRTNPALFGSIKRPDAIMKARKAAVMGAKEKMSALPSINGLASRVASRQKDLSNAQKDLYNAQAYGKKLARVLQKAEDHALKELMGNMDMDVFMRRASRHKALKTFAEAEQKRRVALAHDFTSAREELKSARAALRTARDARANIRRSTLSTLSRNRKPVVNPWSNWNGVKHMLHRPWTGALSAGGFLWGLRDAVNAMEYRRKLLDDMSRYDKEWK